MINRLKKLKIQFSLIILLIFCNGLIYSQGQGIKIPDSLGSTFIYRVSKDRIIKKLEDFGKYLPDELDTLSKWRYHMANSSCKLYLDRDSSLYHFNEAYKIRPKSTCRSMSVRHNYFNKLVVTSI